MVTWHAPPEGSVVRTDVAPFEHVTGPNENGADKVDIAVSVSAVWPSPIFDTVMTCAPVVPAATDPKPTVLGEKDTTGAITPISGVTVTVSCTVIISLSKTSGNESVT